MPSRFPGRSVALLLPVLLCLPQLASGTEWKGELRGFWADGFNEGYKTPQQIDLLLQRLRQAHCNAVFAQVRKGGDAYYGSHYEPWAHDDPNHYDALADLIRKAHALQPRIEVHAWLNVCAVGSDRYHLPGQIATAHPEWLSLNTRLQAADPEVTKIDLGHPDAADWTFRVFMDVVRHYDVDGIHLDFVRYSGKRRGYNPVNVARFYRRFPNRTPAKPADDGVNPPPGIDETASSLNPGSTPEWLPAPNDPNWKQWRRDQVTAWVRKLYAHAVAVKPGIVVSAALIAWEDGPHSEDEWNRKSAAMNLVFQDWRSWLQEGILDLGCPMTYFQARRKGLQRAADWDAWTTAHQYGRAAAPSVGCWENTIPETLTLLSLARHTDTSGHSPYGVLLYSYAGTNESPPDARGRHRQLQLQPEFYATLGEPSSYAHTPPFPADAPIPPMPWKAHPTHGHLKGFVLAPDLSPIDGALVEVRSKEGRVWRRRTDGTGCYAFIDLPAGRSTPSRYTVRAIGPKGEVAKAVADLTAGRVTTVSLTPGRGDAVPLGSIAEIANRPLNASPVRLDDLLVELGTDTDPGNLLVRDHDGGILWVRLANEPIAPFQPGDVVSVIGVPSRVDGEPALEAATARLTDIASSETLPVPAAAHAAQLVSGAVKPGTAARVRGKVTGATSSGFVLEEGGASIHVPLAGRKEFGIDSTALAVESPQEGARVEVTGLITRGVERDGRPSLRLLPRSGSDLVILSRPPLFSTGGRRMLLALTGLLALIATLWLWRRRSRPPQSTDSSPLQ